MLAFSSKWTEAILTGKKNLTFRKWPAARVKPGKVYDAATIGRPPKKFARILVTGIRKIRLSDIDESLARRDGASSPKEVQDYWKKQGFGPNDELWLVEFELSREGEKGP